MHFTAVALVREGMRGLSVHAGKTVREWPWMSTSQQSGMGECTLWGGCQCAGACSGWAVLEISDNRGQCAGEGAML